MNWSDLDDDFVDYDSDYDAKAEAGRAPAVSVDPYAGASHISFLTHTVPQRGATGIFFSKDRREEVIEVEEEPELVEVLGQPSLIQLMTQGEWMKGCPEGGEQGFLFSLYSELSEGKCACPQGCGHSVTRNKSDFFSRSFAIFSSFSFWTVNASI